MGDYGEIETFKSLPVDLLDMPPLGEANMLAIQIGANSLPLYVKYLEGGLSTLYTEEYFQKFKSFPAGPILFRTDRQELLSQIKDRGLTKRNFWVIPQRSERPQKFGDEYKEFLKRLYFTWIWWFIFSRMKFSEAMINSFDLSKTRWLEMSDFVSPHYEHAPLALKELEIQTRIETFISPNILFAPAMLEVGDFKKIGWLDFWRAGIKWRERGFYRSFRLYESLMMKFFEILSEKKRLI